MEFHLGWTEGFCNVVVEVGSGELKLSLSGLKENAPKDRQGGSLVDDPTEPGSADFSWDTGMVILFMIRFQK